WEDEAYCIAKGQEVYGHEYAIHFPTHAWPAGRERRLSPLHGRLRARGAQFAPYNGWERALWFARPGDDTSEAAQRTFRRAGPWFGAVAAECAAVRDHVGVLDLPGFSRFDLEGPGAAVWLDARIAGRLPREGRIGLAYFPDDKGRIVTEMSVMRRGADAFTLITAAVAQSHDREWLARDLAPGLTLADRTDDLSTLIVTGPAARALLGPLAEADLALPWLTHQAARVAGRPCHLVRVSFAGELGWEVHAAPADIPAIWDALVAGGAVPFGMLALNNLRIEKGYRAWKGDLSTDYTLLQGGLERFIDWGKDFRGRGALEAERQRGVTKRFVTLKVEAPDCDPPYMATLWHDGQVAGEVTSAAWGFRVGACLALGMLRADLAVPDTAVTVEVFGAHCPAVVLPDAPVWDPANARLRA
ncbi:MAG: glycine cleavage T C-terminal barrel domain-containing protein, partial [Gemmobacter sp.]